MECWDTSFFAFLQFVGGSTGSTGDDSNDVRALKNTASGGSTGMPLGATLGTFFFECIRSRFSFTHQQLLVQEQALGSHSTPQYTS